MREYINIKNNKAFECLAEHLYTVLSQALKNGYKSIMIVCIGTDRSTGDSLGPLVGYKLNGLSHDNVFVFGNLDEPVHAKNLCDMHTRIGDTDKPFVLAIDACLGKQDHVGYIVIGDGPIRPGSGVGKELAPIGDAHITGIVNFGGFMDFLVLQNTRMSVVMKMADTISTAIKYTLWRISQQPIVEAAPVEEVDACTMTLL